MRRRPRTACQPTDHADADAMTKIVTRLTDMVDWFTVTVSMSGHHWMSAEKVAPVGHCLSVTALGGYPGWQSQRG